MEEAARFVGDLLGGAGFATQLLPIGGFPVVYTDTGTQAGRTLLCYNHYDVQPEEPLDLWDSQPVVMPRSTCCVGLASPTSPQRYVVMRCIPARPSPHSGSS
jgi:hypothetical protein